MNIVQHPGSFIIVVVQSNSNFELPVGTRIFTLLEASEYKSTVDAEFSLRAGYGRERDKIKRYSEIRAF